MTASTLSHLPLAAGSAVASALGRAGMWTLARYMRAPLASTGLLVMVTMTAMAASNALYNQHMRHPAPFFAVPSDVPTPVEQPLVAPIPAPAPTLQIQQPIVTSETTGSLAAPQTIPDAPVGNTEAFAVQKKLAELGLFTGKVDGFYGPMTASAIRSFETRNGMTPTGALTPAVVDAILRSDASGRSPVAQVAPQPAIQVVPAPVQQAAIVQPAPVPRPAPIVQDQVVAQLPTLTPVDNAVDAVGNAAAQTIDSIVAAVGGTRTPPAAMQLMPAAAAQPMPPVQIASIEPMTVAPQAKAQVQTQAAAAPVDPANNTQLVSQIQRGLASLGFYQGSIDGHPGDATARAIREFENFHSFRVTGQINPDLVQLLQGAGASI